MRITGRGCDDVVVRDRLILLGDAPLLVVVNTAGRVSSAALSLSGWAGALMPRKVATALQLPAHSGRGLAETRAGLGGTYASLGAWALLSRRPAAHTAVGVTWLGAATARLVALGTDDPEPDATYWAYLAAELVLGFAAVISGTREARTRST